MHVQRLDDIQTYMTKILMTLCLQHGNHVV